jgi:hypothetical protein
MFAAKNAFLGGGFFRFVQTISANQTNYNLNTQLTSAGWPSTVPVQATVTINSGVEVTSTAITTAAFIVGSLPTGSVVTVINNGVIAGRGGIGGRLGSSGAISAGRPGGVGLQIASPVTITNNNIIAGGGGGGGLGGDVIGFFCQGTDGAAGGAGGAAISMTANVTLTNNGTIAGGGGGGGGGASASQGTVNESFSAGGGGGGGGRGYLGGGRAYFADNDTAYAGCSFGSFPSDPRLGKAGTDGTWTAVGSGGAAGTNSGRTGGAGGAGGSLGSAGVSGGNATWNRTLIGGTGGAAGAGVLRPSGTLTLLVTGTINGAY